MVYCPRSVYYLISYFSLMVGNLHDLYYITSFNLFSSFSVCYFKILRIFSVNLFDNVSLLDYLSCFSMKWKIICSKKKRWVWLNKESIIKIFLSWTISFSLLLILPFKLCMALYINSSYLPTNIVNCLFVFANPQTYSYF